jgi:hypothetical protein
VVEYRIEFGITAAGQLDEVGDGALAIHEQQHHALAAVERKLIDLL